MLVWQLGMEQVDRVLIIMAEEKASQARTFELCPLRRKALAEEDVDMAEVAKQEEEGVCVAAE